MTQSVLFYLYHNNLSTIAVIHLYCHLYSTVIPLYFREMPRKVSSYYQTHYNSHKHCLLIYNKNKVTKTSVDSGAFLQKRLKKKTSQKTSAYQQLHRFLFFFNVSVNAVSTIK